MKIVLDTVNYNEKFISGTAGYELTAATWLPGGNKIIFVTTPVRTCRSDSIHAYGEKSVIIGFLNISTFALGSIVTEPCRLPRVHRIVTWKNGILLCSAAGLAYLDFESGATQILVEAEQLNGQTVCDVAVHQNGSVWFICKPENQPASRLFCLDLAKASTPIEVPVGAGYPTRIHFSVNCVDLYAGLECTGTIYRYKTDSTGLSDEMRLTFIRLASIDQLRVDETGSLHVASLSEIIRFTKSGDFAERIKTQVPVVDFLVVSPSQLYILHEQGWSLVEKKQARRARKFFVVPRI